MKGLLNSFFFVPNGRNSVKVGELLVAEPFMKDKWFGRSVISVIDSSENEGTTGLVLNIEITATLSEIFNDVKRDGVPVFCGGPVGHDQLLFLHTLGDGIIPDGKEILPGLWLGGNFSSAVEYVNSGYPIDGHIRFFVGYSGWSPGQLADELNENTWAVPDRAFSSHGLLTGNGNNYWTKIVASMGNRYRPWLVVPEDSRAN